MTTGYGSDVESELRALSRQPKEQMLRALAILSTATDAATRDAALSALAKRCGARTASERAVLLALLEYLGKEGPKRDAGGYVRIAVLRALRQAGVLATDSPLLERATTTYEFGQRGEVAADLRAEALLTLSHADADLAAFHAVRLLRDEHALEMNGQPALMAAQVLAAQDLALSLYAYVLEPDGRPPEAVSEALRGLRRLPDKLVSLLFRRYRDCGSEIATLGLIDLVLSHAARGELAPLLFDLLSQTSMYDVYHYAVTAIVTTHDDTLLTGLVRLAEKELDRRKLDSLASALPLASADERVAECLAEVRHKLRRT